jgi:acetylglutamate kinase
MKSEPMKTTTVVKVGGNELDDQLFLMELCRTLAALERRLVLVHGGGKEISAALEHYGQAVQFIDGVRVTPPESMAIMEMVVCGRINKRIVAGLVLAGRPALGLSGVDMGLLRCEPYRPDGLDLGRVGKITRVDVPLLRQLLAPGWLPVIAPVALGHDDGLSYNVNADHVALAVASALADDAARATSTELVFISNVPGVLLGEQVVPQLVEAEVEEYIQSGGIKGGMIPKVRSALAALAGGIETVRITNLAGLATGGTSIVKGG